MSHFPQIDLSDLTLITLDESDDIVTVCDRLAWSGARQAVLLLPETGGVLHRGLDLVQLRRFVDRERIEVGLVTPDTALRRQATALGIPAFRTVQQAQGRRGWWRGRRRLETVGLPINGNWKTENRKQKTENEKRLTENGSRKRWLLRYAGILLFFIAAALLYVGFVMMVPGATVTLRPLTTPLTVTQTVLADPALTEIDYAARALPGRPLTVTVSWETEVRTSGVVEIPSAPARGAVLFENVAETAVTLPAGTRVSTGDDGLLFQTESEANLPAVAGSTVEVGVTAVTPGRQGNVAAEQITQVEGALAEQVTVRNVEAFSGGGVRPEAAVSDTDVTRLRAQALQYLQALAASEMEAALTPFEFLPRDSVRVTRILEETFSHAVGAQTERLALTMAVAMQGTAVNTNEASGLAYEALIAEVPDGYTLLPDTLTFSSGELLGVDDAGRVQFVMAAAASAAADLPLTQSLAAIAGQETETAAAYLQAQLPLQTAPEIAVWPVWFDRVPYAPARIRTEIVP